MADLIPNDARVSRDETPRAVAVVGLAGVGLIHLLDAHDTFISTPYLGWLYVALILGSTATAWRLLHQPDVLAWASSALVGLAPAVGVVISRTVGLPGGAEDIGNWWQPLGLASLFVEGLLIGLSATVLYDYVGASVTVPMRTIRQPRMVEESSHG